MKTKFVSIPQAFASFTPHPLLVILKNDNEKVRIHEKVHIRQMIEDGWIPVLLRYYLTAWGQREYELEAEAEEDLYLREQQKTPDSLETWAAREAREDVKSHPAGYRNKLPWSREPSFPERVDMVLGYMTGERERDMGSPVPWYVGFWIGSGFLHFFASLLPFIGGIAGTVVLIIAGLIICGDILARFVEKPDQFVVT